MSIPDIYGNDQRIFQNISNEMITEESQCNLKTVRTSELLEEEKENNVSINVYDFYIVNISNSKESCITLAQVTRYFHYRSMTFEYLFIFLL